jgi:hypothetical protein
MSKESFLKFLLAARNDPVMLGFYDRRNLSQLLFHARAEGYDFSADDVADVAGPLEYSVIVNKDNDPFDETSRLWREMWGQRHLGYLITKVVWRLSDAELQAIVTPPPLGTEPEGR